MKKLLMIAAAFAFGAISALPALATPEPGIPLYHVGIDNRPTFVSGAYLGQANPNYQRLTMFLSHTFLDTPTNNHFHRIGAYILTGPAATPAVGFSTNDRLPEPYQLDDGLSLLPGSGPFAGKFVSGLGQTQMPENHIEEEYGNLTLHPMNELFQYDSQPDPDGLVAFHPGHYLLNASGGIYKSSIAGTTVGLRLESISPGLTVHDASGTQLFSAVGEIVTLGTGAAWSFNPVFAVDSTVAAGTKFAARFTLVDRSSSPLYGDSAAFTYDFTTVPEPTAVCGVLAALLGTAISHRR